MLAGIVDAVAEKGYVKTSVADVLHRVRVSRETFYQHFRDKEECFLAAVDQCVDVLFGVFESEIAAGAQQPPAGRFERAVGVYFDRLAASPALARTLYVEVYAAGEAAIAKRLDVQDRFVDLTKQVFERDPRWRALPDPRFACRALAGAISSLVTSTVAAGEPKRLPELREDVMDLLGHLMTR
jgi:TetR/AcrR family transcriptional regulator